MMIREFLFVPFHSVCSIIYFSIVTTFFLLLVYFVNFNWLLGGSDQGCCKIFCFFPYVQFYLVLLVRERSEKLSSGANKEEKRLNRREMTFKCNISCWLRLCLLTCQSIALSLVDSLLFLFSIIVVQEVRRHVKAVLVLIP